MNSKMAELYNNRNKSNDNLATNFVRSGIYTVLFFFLPNALPPLTNQLFGYPKIVIWTFPFSVRYVIFSNYILLPDNKLLEKSHILSSHSIKIFFSVSFQFSVPFNTETYVGFYTELIIQMFTVHFYMLIFSSVITIFSAFDTFIEGLVIDYSESLEHFNKVLTPHKNHTYDIENETKHLLKNSIELHIGIVK